MPASDVYSWAKASSKPIYKWSEISMLSLGSHVYNSSSTDNFTFTAKSGYSYIIATAQDAASIKNASITSSSGLVTIRLTAPVTVCRVCYCIFNI